MNKKRKNSFIYGAAWLALSTLLLKVIGLVYKIPLSYMLGDEGMGYFNSAYTVYVFFYVVGTTGIPKSISILVAKKEAESVGAGDDVFRSAFKFFFAFGLILAIAFFSFADIFAKAIGNQKSVFAMYSIAPSMLFVCAAGVLRGYLSGKMKFAPIAISELISGVLKLTLGLLLARLAVSSGKNLPSVASYTILGITVGSLVSLIYLCAVCSRPLVRSKNRSGGQRETVSEVLKIAIPITLGSALSSVVSIIDLALIMNGLKSAGTDATLANVLYGNYTTLAVPMLSLVSTFVTPITTAMLPLLASDFMKKDGRVYSENLTTALTLTAIISTPCAVFFAIFSRQALSVIFEESSAALGAPFLSLLAPAILLVGPLAVLNTSLEASGKPSVAFVSLSVGAIGKLILTAFLLWYTDLGILCAPIGTSVYYILSYLISHKCAQSGGEIEFSVTRALLAPTIASVTSTAIVLICRSFISFHGSIRLSGLIYIAVFFSSYVTMTLLLSAKARNMLFKCVKINKKTRCNL